LSLHLPAVAFPLLREYCANIADDAMVACLYHPKK